VVKISLRKNLIVGGLVAILGCSRQDESGNSAKQEKPSAPVQENQTKHDQPMPPFPNTDDLKIEYKVTYASKVVTFYDKNLVGTEGSINVDNELSDLCKKNGYVLSMIPLNWEKEKRQYNLTDAKTSMILIHHYDKDKTATEVERYPVEDRKQLESQLEQELQYHGHSKGKPPIGCRKYKKE